MKHACSRCRIRPGGDCRRGVPRSDGAHGFGGRLGAGATTGAEGRVGLAIEPQRFLTPVNVKLLHRLQQLCADNDVRLLYRSSTGLDADRPMNSSPVTPTSGPITVVGLRYKRR